MISSTDFRTGLTIEIDGGVWQVVEFQHVKPGKGAAFVRTKIKNDGSRRRAYVQPERKDACGASRYAQDAVPL